MKQVFGLVNAIGLSEVHCNFTRKHLTYGPAPEIVNNAGSDDFEIHLVHTLSEGVATNSPLSAALRVYTLSVVQWLFDESIGGKITANTEATNAQIAIAFNTNDTLVVAGPIRTDASNRNLPESIEITHFGDIVKLWLYPQALDEQYDIRQYVVAKPIPDINSFVTSNKSVLTTFIAPYVENPYNAVNLIIGNNPATRLTQYTSLWQNKDNKSETMEVSFSIAVYGPGDIDSIEVRTALKDYLLLNSTHTALIWENVFPELFNISTFTILPAYDMVVDGNVPEWFTPIVTPGNYKAMFTSDLMAFDAARVNLNMDVLPTVYQSMACLVMPDNANSPEAGTLRYFYGDYILKDNLSREFILMDSTTRAFVNKLLDALPVAHGNNTVMPNGITEEYVLGVKYIAFTVADCHIRVVPRAEFTNIKNSLL